MGPSLERQEPVADTLQFLGGKTIVKAKPHDTISTRKETKKLYEGNSHEKCKQSGRKREVWGPAPINILEVTSYRTSENVFLENWIQNCFHY